MKIDALIFVLVQVLTTNFQRHLFYIILDAHSPGCFMVQKAEKSKKIFRKFRHVTGLLSVAMQAAFPCFQKTIV